MGGFSGTTQTKPRDIRPENTEIMKARSIETLMQRTKPSIKGFSFPFLIIPESLTYLPFQVSCFIWGGPGQHSRVTEAGSQECPQYKHEQHTSYDWNNWGQLQSQVRTTGRTGKAEREMSKEYTRDKALILSQIVKT